MSDDFFRIGGDSILSIQVASRVRQAGFNCLVKDIFEFKTIQTLADYLSNARISSVIKSEQGLLTGECELLPIQQFFKQQVDRGLITNPDHWNQSFLVKVPELQVSVIEPAVHMLVAHHDVLRMKYANTTDGIVTRWTQTYQQTIATPPLRVLDVSVLSKEAVQAHLTDWQSGFNLSEGPLFQFGYLQGYEDGSARIFLALHHLIIDAVSWRILIEDMKALCQGLQLPAKTNSYSQWTEVVKEYAHVHHAETNWWVRHLESITPFSVDESLAGCVSKFELTDELTHQLLHDAPLAYHTQINDLLLTALAYALHDLNGCSSQGVTLEGHGRESTNSSVDISRTVGWFTVVFPVKLELDFDMSSSIKTNKEALRRIPNKGIGYGALSTFGNAPFSSKDLPRIVFNYLGQFDNAEGLWQVVAEDSGVPVPPSKENHSIIDVTCLVTNGRLQFRIVSRLGRATAELLSSSLEQRLIEVIEHCISQVAMSTSEFTPSDFGPVQISQELLGRLQA